MHASCPPRHHFAAPVTSRLRCRHRAGTRSAPAAWRRLRCSASLLDTLAAVNAEALARKEGSEQVGAKTGIAPLTSVPVVVAEAKASACAKLLEKLGCLSLTGALSPESCRSLLAYVNDENARSQAAVLAGDVAFDSRFGGVNCRGLTTHPFGVRQDLFLPVSAPEVRKALAEITGNLELFLDALVGEEAMFHEMSSLVAGPSSPRQCVHADTIVLPCPQYPDVSMEPLYTFFVALQDVEDGMGHTQFLPGTHSPDSHELWNAAAKSERLKGRFIALQPAQQSCLKAGDIAAFDSRVLHCGCANTTSKPRVLFYVTLSRAQRWPLPGGLHGSNSVREEDRWQWQLRDVRDVRHV